jgi:hypothetical protein
MQPIIVSINASVLKAPNVFHIAVVSNRGISSNVMRAKFVQLLGIIALVVMRCPKGRNERPHVKSRRALWRRCRSTTNEQGKQNRKQYCPHASEAAEQRWSVARRHRSTK